MQRSLSPRVAIGCVLALLLAACTPQTASPSSQPPGQKPSFEATPSALPSVEPTESPATAEPSASADDPGQLGFTVMPNPDADALFLDRDQCENSEDGYRLQFPEAWYTNTEIGDVPPCSWFSPTFYEADESGDVPSEIAITIDVVPGAFGFTGNAISSERVTVGATQDATRTETEHEATADGEVTAYVYVVQLGPDPNGGPNLIASTNSDMGGDYELNKAVLDRIMATIEFLGTVQ